MRAKLSVYGQTHWSINAGLIMFFRKKKFKLVGLNVNISKESVQGTQATLLNI